MMRCRVCVLLVALVVQPAAAVSGVQKVIQMLTGMQAKAKQGKMDEETAFAQFETWCSTKTAFFKEEIEKNGVAIETLTAESAKLQDAIKVLGEEIGALEAGITSNKASQKKETEEREAGRKAFELESQDYSESVDAVERALVVLQKQDYDRTGAAAGAALAQVSKKAQVPANVKAIVTAFIEMVDLKKGTGSDSDSDGAPEANAYEFQSGGIISILKKLLDEFREKLGTCQKEEMNAQAAHDMVMMELTDSIENAARDVEAKTKTKASKSERLAKTKRDLALTEAELKENKATLSSMKTECHEKSLSFEEKQQLRAEEIEAIGKAIEIMKSPEVSGSAEKHLSLAQAQATAKALLQLAGANANAGATSEKSIRRTMRDFLARESRRLKSQKIGLLAEQIGQMDASLIGASTQIDVFKKVKKMIDSMITRLLKEAEADAKHEGFCDKEIGQSKVTRTKLTEEIDSLTAACEEGKATIETLTDEVSDLSSEVAELWKSMAEATDLRKQEKAKNEATIEDSKAAQSALNAAMKVLKDFYDKAGTATALVQSPSLLQVQRKPRAFAAKTSVKLGSPEWNALANPEFEEGTQADNYGGKMDTGHKEGMQTFGDNYQGQQDENAGVMAMLEVIASDFASLQADTEDAEAESASTYESMMNESKKNKAMNEKSIEMKSADKVSAEQKLSEDTADLKSTQDELIAANKYYQKLVPQCHDQGQTFEERSGSRSEEIASLKEALKILSSQDLETSA